MPFTNLSTGGFTNSAGIYNFTGGTVTSTLNGQYVRITDTCGAISQAAGRQRQHRLRHLDRHRLHDAGQRRRGQHPLRPRPSSTRSTASRKSAAAGCPRTPGCNATADRQRQPQPDLQRLLERLDAQLLQVGRRLRQHRRDRRPSRCTSTATASTATTATAPPPTRHRRGLRRLHRRHRPPHLLHRPRLPDQQLRRLRRRLHGLHRRARHRLGQARLQHAGHGGATSPRCAAAPAPAPAARKSTASPTSPREAIWDLANRDLPSPGTGPAWTDPRPALVPLAHHRHQLLHLHHRRHLHRRTAAAPATGGRRMRAVDDDDGNLANGTPHGGALFAAFNRHGIACTTDAGATTTSPAAPRRPRRRSRSPPATTRRRSPGRLRLRRVYDVFRNETGCNAGFTKIANDSSATLAQRHRRRQRHHLLLPGDAHPSGNEACASAA